MCEFEGEKGCKKTSLKVKARYFFGNTLVLGNITNITDSCMCIATEYCIPLNSIFKMLLPFKKKVLDVPVIVNRYEDAYRHHDTMSVEVLNPSKEYTDFVGSFGSMSEAQKIC